VNPRENTNLNIAVVCTYRKNRAQGYVVKTIETEAVPKLKRG
jgi:hypothetical protein